LRFNCENNEERRNSNYYPKILIDNEYDNNFSLNGSWEHDPFDIFDGEELKNLRKVDSPQTEKHNEDAISINASFCSNYSYNTELNDSFKTNSYSDVNDLIELVQKEVIEKKNSNNNNNQSFENETNIDLKITDFQIIINLSSGGYGSVDLCKKIKTESNYAIKTVNISKMVII